MKYQIVVEAKISLSVTVEADDVAGAVAKAHDAPIMSLCHQCARGEPDEWSTSGELDGSVSDDSTEVVAVYVDDQENDQALADVRAGWAGGR